MYSTCCVWWWETVWCCTADRGAAACRTLGWISNGRSPTVVFGPTRAGRWPLNSRSPNCLSDSWERGKDAEWQRLRNSSCERNAASLALDRFPNSRQRAVIWLSRRHNRFHIKIAHKQTKAPCLSDSWGTMVISEMSPWCKPNRTHARVCVWEELLLRSLVARSLAADGR